MNNQFGVMGKPEIPQIRTAHYWSLLGDAYLTLWIASEAVGQNQEKIASGLLSRGLPELVDKVIKEGLPAGQRDEIVKRGEEANREKVRNYLETLENLAVVMLCSVFEIFLNELLESVFRSRPETLLAFGKNKNLSLEKIIQSGDYDEILRGFRQKELFAFSREEIGVKFRLLKKLGIEQGDVFAFSTHERLKGYDLHKLVKIFNKRHSIIHEAKRPFQSDEEVVLIKEFLEQIIWNLSEVVSRKYKIPIDMFGYFAAWMPSPNT